MDYFDFYRNLPGYLSIGLPPIAVVLAALAVFKSEKMRMFIIASIALVFGTVSSCLVLHFVFDSIMAAIQIVVVLGSLHLLGFASSVLWPILGKKIT